MTTVPDTTVRSARRDRTLPWWGFGLANIAVVAGHGAAVDGPR